jgi:hypothetical protein
MRAKIKSITTNQDIGVYDSVLLENNIATFSCGNDLLSG